VIAIPDRLEQPVAKAQHQNVLHRFLSEVVIDAVDLVLVQNLEELAIECLRGRKVGAERLLDDEPAPGPLLLVTEARLAEMTTDRRERGRRGRKVEQAVAAGLASALGPRQRLLQPLVACRVLGVAVDVTDAAEEAARDRLIDRGAGKTGEPGRK